MVEDDTFTYHVKQQPADQLNKPVQSLITKERTQKLDLLIHLLSNLTQALVVCGPEGIGKTTLLKILQERKAESWRYCLIQGNAAVSFETVREQLVKAQSAHSLSTASERSAGQYKQVVLIIDNAGALVPGLIAAILQYAAASPALRVVFALTHDELQMKRVSDQLIDDCHIIEIPSLSEKQCGDFLQHLSTKPYANLSFKAIGDNMVAHIYRETHGVPGRIIAAVSGLSSGAKQGGKLKWVLVLAVAAAIAIALGVQWLMSVKDNAKNAMTPAAAEQKANNTEVAPPRPESQIMLPLPPVQPAARQQSLPANEANKSKDALESPDEVNVNRIGQPPVSPTEISKTASTAVDKPIASDAPRSPVIAGQSPADPVPPGAEQDKPNQLELSKTTNGVEPPAAQDFEIKSQSESVVTIEGGKQQSGTAQQKKADQLWTPQEKSKQAELKKSANSIEPVAPNQAQQKPAKVTAIPEERVTESATPQQAQSEASLSPSVNNFTLQLMVLSKQSSADDILNKYPALGPDIRVIRTIAKGKGKFILEYGSYPDAASANKARESLPFEFHRALVRKIAQ